jgi:hypothetical protein
LNDAQARNLSLAASFFGVRRWSPLWIDQPIQSGDQRRTPKKLAAIKRVQWLVRRSGGATNRQVKWFEPSKLLSKGVYGMRIGFALCLGLFLATGTQEARAAKRYGIEANLDSFPQATPKEALASVIQAIENKRIDYLLAQLTEPDFVDQRVKEVYGGDFDELVKETTTKLNDNPGTLKELRRFLKEGDWENADTTATAKLKDVKDRQVFMKKVDKRWYLENRQKAETEK